ncbi:MAG: L-fucose/L-arabinose isomerase family protein [Planctomycetia bacterium]|nr:L-fucose/L-arabinose isomerase family protein [Planctomycetia bacterium]
MITTAIDSPILTRIPVAVETGPKAVSRRKELTARVGVVGVGYDKYWSQFEGLRDSLLGKQEVLCEQVATCGVHVSDFGLVDNAPSATAVIPRLLGADLDLIFVDMLTYATSATIGKIFREVNIPIVLVALQPLQAMDYRNGTTYMQLCNDDFCSVPEFTGVAIRMGRRPPEIIIGTLDNDQQKDAAIAKWCSIAKVLHDLKHARIGLMGHVLEAMLDMHVDPTAVTEAVGAHIVPCEPEDILQFYSDQYIKEIAAKEADILDFFDTPDPGSDPLAERLTPHDLKIAAKASVALDKFVEYKNLDGFAYYYEGSADTSVRELVTNLIVGNTLLTSAGFPMCGEYDLKTCVAMMIMDRLETGGSFAEFHPIDFTRNTVLVGHDGPHHINIADRRPVLRSLKKYHGKPGSGASVEFNIRKGPITMLSIGINGSGKLKFIIAEGESLAGPIPPTGNTNTHGSFGPDVREFLCRWVAEGPTHHFALGTGHNAETLRCVANCLGIESVIVR